MRTKLDRPVGIPVNNTSKIVPETIEWTPRSPSMFIAIIRKNIMTVGVKFREVITFSKPVAGKEDSKTIPRIVAKVRIAVSDPILVSR